jgi:hypothetical protein
VGVVKSLGRWGADRWASSMRKKLELNTKSHFILLGRKDFPALRLGGLRSFRLTVIKGRSLRESAYTQKLRNAS